MLNSPLPVRRSAFTALAAIALLAVLLRPACELAFAHFAAGAAAVTAGVPIAHGGDPAVQCCANVSAGQQLAPLPAVAGSVGASEGVAPAALAAMVIGIAMFAGSLHWLRAPLRRPKSFYLRSARILR